MIRFGHECDFEVFNQGQKRRCEPQDAFNPNAGRGSGLGCDGSGPGQVRRYRLESSVPGKDFTRGEFVLTEQRPRMQSRAEVVSLQEGDGVAFAVTHRPVQGSKGTYRVNLRHGVSRLRSGHRNTMGIIFHDGK